MEKIKLGRPPVVAVLGHVDHGKTTLLDTIRKGNVAEREFGGITQHIGAYEITTSEGKKITFIDTPGHEAFNNLRKRGVAIADIALLVVAANDSVQPQTIDALNVIRESKIPYIIVINKIDVPDIRIEKVLKDLSRNGVYVEGNGGDVPVAKVSAKSGEGIPHLLELITLVSEINGLSQSESDILGGIIEVKKDRRGIVATVVVKNGMLKIGDTIYVGNLPVRVKSLWSDTGAVLNEIFPSTPAELLGCSEMVVPGTPLTKTAQTTITPSLVVTKEKSFKEDFFATDKKKFNFIIRADSVGSEEVIREKFCVFNEVSIVNSGIGDVTEADIELAISTKANIIAFNVKLSKQILHKAETGGVSLFSYNLIYELLDEIEDLILNLRNREEKEARKIGEAKILAEFIKDTGKIAGLKIISGKAQLKSIAEVLRGKKSLGETTIKSLYQKTSAVSEAKKGEECGALFTTPIDFRVGDIVKLYNHE